MNEKERFMKPEKIISVVEMYEKRLKQEGVVKRRMDTKCTFKSLNKKQLLEHAFYLVDGIKIYVKDPAKQRKTGSHLTAIQMCLSFAGWYTLEDLMSHNRTK